MHERAAHAGGAAAEGVRRLRQAGGRDRAATPRPTSSSKLADLKSQGVLTDAEFDAQKAKILAS